MLIHQNNFDSVHIQDWKNICKHMSPFYIFLNSNNIELSLERGSKSLYLCLNKPGFKEEAFLFKSLVNAKQGVLLRTLKHFMFEFNYLLSMDDGYWPEESIVLYLNQVKQRMSLPLIVLPYGYKKTILRTDNPRRYLRTP